MNDRDVVPRDRDGIVLSPEDRQLINEYLRPGAVIEAIIPKDPTSEQLWNTLSTCAKGVGYLQTRILRLRPIIGHILLLFQNTPSLYKDRGYRTFEDFLTKGVRGTLGLGRTTVYDALALARDWPQISPERFARIGPKSMNIIKSFARGDEANIEKYLKLGEEMGTGELRRWAESRGLVNPGETVPYTIEIHANIEIYKEWRDFINDPRVQSHAGKAPWQILRAMVQECWVEWIEKGEQG